MNSNLSRVLVATCALIALATGIWVANEKRQTAQLLAATKFELPDLDGEMRTLNDWQGKLRIVNFWATWCAPCREEIPLFNAVQQVFGGQGLQIIGVAVDDLDIASSFAEQIGMTFPSLVAGRYGMELLEPFEA
ncbi:MAG: TlpA disulfide reductase family protein, partial [Arenicellales bacterium WSBS_2016_MAG_OTU3]